MINVLVAEDSDDLRAAVVTLINEEKDMHCVGDTACLAAVASMVQQFAPHVVVLDVELQGESSLMHLSALRALAPQSKFVIFSGHSPPQFMRGAIAAGAAAYVQKSGNFDEILNAIRAVMQT